VNDRVSISRANLDAIVEHARRTAPFECCGLLVGTAGEVRSAIPTANLSSDPNHFAIDPKDHLAGRREARRRGLEVLGFYHSLRRGQFVEIELQIGEKD
jgi:proteasome lid subunit RPN8/RPN11